MLVHTYLFPHSLTFAFVVIIYITCVRCQCHHNTTVDLTNAYYSSQNQTYLLENVTYTRDNYYHNGDKVVGCLCDVNVCVTYCCPFGESKINGTCQPFNKQSSTIDIYNAKQLRMENVLHIPIVIKNKCNAYLLDPNEVEEDQFYIQRNGTLYNEDTGIRNHDRYCLTYFHDDVDKLQAIVCGDDGEMEEDPFSMHMTFKSIGMIISIPFLFLTFVVYIVLADNNIGKKCQTAYVFCLMCAYIFLVYIQFHNSLEHEVCISLASLCLYFFMSSFCWVNISCIDIFWTFSGRRGITNRNSNHWRRFICYTAYANGVPISILAIIFALNKEENEGKWFYPQFGVGQCWLGGNYPLLLYFYGPMGFLLIVNTILFIFTALQIRKHQRETAVLRTDESKKHYDHNKQMYHLFFKLILAMGINWTMEFISWCVDTLMKDRKIEELWIVTDLCNALYGVFIFILFICKRNIWISLQKKYYIFMGKPNKARALSTRTNTYQMSETEKTNIDSSIVLPKC